MPDPKPKKKPAKPEPKVEVKGSADRGVKLDIGPIKMLEPWQVHAGRAEMLDPWQVHAGEAAIMPPEHPRVEIGMADITPPQEHEAVPPMPPGRASPKRARAPMPKAPRMPAWGDYATQFGRK